jgi:hypothetical protein
VGEPEAIAGLWDTDRQSCLRCRPRDGDIGEFADVQ